MGLYDELYQLKSYGYPKTRPGVACGLLQGHEHDTLLDVSAGRGQFARLARDELKLEVHVTEVVQTLLDNELSPFHATRWELPHPAPFNHKFDIVTCLDVLEHLPEHTLPYAIEELWYSAKYQLLLSVGTHNCPWPMPDGTKVETHETVRPAPWWLELVTNHVHGGFVQFGREINGSYYIMVRCDP